MWVEFGNDNAIEGYREPGSDEVKYRALEGQQVTTITLPEGVSLQEAFTTAVALVDHHFAVANEADGTRHKPAWVDSDSEGLKALLTENFGLKAGHARPKTWGKDNGLHENNHLASAFVPGEDRTAGLAPKTADKEG